ncbi:MAG: isopeptide-forming domain-containing fimbrial protein [Lachnospiraceae bacterium]|nr:isopeptide-forming domain-containing fimbrial protein [Lachnospiraceae bacterium]
MKNARRLLSMLLVSIMVLTMSLPVFATDVTITGRGKTYAAYELLKEESRSTDGVIYSVRDEYRATLQAVTKKTTDKEIIDYLAGLNGNQTEIDKFAKEMHAALSSGAATQTLAGSDTGVTFTGLEEGYYLFLELEPADEWKTTDPVTGEFINHADEVSKAMLQPVTGESMTIAAKEDEVTSKKKVQETNDSTGYTSDWQDAADYDIGDHVPFQLSGKISGNYDEYDTYFFEFQDKMSAGLTFDGTVEVYLNDTTLIDQSAYVLTKISDQEFTVTFDDLKTRVPAAKAGDEIYVYFTATLNENAEIGATGNTNESRIRYSNNPNNKDDFGFTPWDLVIVFTYTVEANKVTDQGDALVGASFELFKVLANGTEISLGEIDGTQLSTFTWKGIDAGKYILRETQTPPGYNTIADIEFEVKAEYETIAEKAKLTRLYVEPSDVFTATLTQTGEISGMLEGDIVNESGIELPSTGGIGTTIFYVVGALMMIGAGVVLVTRRRVQK